MSFQVSAPPSPRTVRTGERHVRLLIPLLMGPLIYVYMQATIIPAIGALAQSVHSSRLATTWALTAYLVSGAVSTPLAGRLGDLFGNRRILVWALWITAAGGVVSAASHVLIVVVIGRVLAGTCTATLPLGYGVMRENLSSHRLTRSIPLVAVAIAIGTAVGNVSSGVVVEHLGVAGMFWLPLILTVPTAVMAQLWVPDSPARERGTVHWRGAAAMSIALLAILIAISESTTWGWGSARTLGLLAFGLVALVGWVLVELAADQPLIDMRLMALPGVWWTNLTSLLFGMAMFGAFVVVPELVEAPRSSGGFAAGLTAAGLFLVPGTVTMSLGGPLSGRLEHRFGPKLPLVIGGVLGAIGYALLCLLHRDRAVIYGAFLLLGVGMGVGYAVLPHLIVRAVPSEHTGAATGINVIARNVGGALGIQITATVIAASAVGAAHRPSEGGFRAALWVLAGASVGATVCAMCIPTGRRRTLRAAEAA